MAWLSPSPDIASAVIVALNRINVGIRKARYKLAVLLGFGLGLSASAQQPLLDYSFDDQVDPTANLGTLGIAYDGDLVGNVTFEPSVSGFAVRLDGNADWIIPLGPPVLRAPKPGQAIALEIRHYGNKASRGRIYSDDGETFAFERGEHAWADLIVDLDETGKRTGRMENADPRFHRYESVTWTFLGQ